MSFPARGRPGAFTFAGERWNSLDPGLVQYLTTNQGTARYLVATPTSSYASLFMLVTEQPAMALGGYQGWDRILTPDQLAELVANGTVRFFLLSGASGPTQLGAGQDATADLTAWVRASCATVPAELWQTSASGTTPQPGSGPAAPGPGGRPGPGFGPSRQAQRLYDCGTPGQ